MQSVYPSGTPIRSSTILAPSGPRFIYNRFRQEPTGIYIYSSVCFVSEDVIFKQYHIREYLFEMLRSDRLALNLPVDLHRNFSYSPNARN